METKIGKENELIAKFMGRERLYESTHEIFVSNLKYHESWDWLMPVVEKIEILGFHFEIWGKRASIRNQHFDQVWECDTKIEAVYNTCLDFIKWRNREEFKVKK